MAINKKKLSIKKVIKAQIDLNARAKSSTPILNKPKPTIIEKQKALQELKNNTLLDNEYRDTQNNKPYTKQDAAFYRGSVDGRFRDLNKEKEDLMVQFRNEFEAKKTEGYVVKENVDYDIVICISSYNRHNKILNLLTQLYSQVSKYTYKVILLDDGSPDPNYGILKEVFPELEYVRNFRNNGRKYYWYTVTQLWQKAKEYSSHAILMIDDDFKLADNFLSVLGDFYFHIKNENNSVVAVAPHLHSFALSLNYMPWWFNTYSIDGIGMFDRDFIKDSFDFRLMPVTDEQLAAEAHAHGWSQIQKKIRELNKIAYKTRYSIAFHDGNDESQLGKGNKNKSKAYTYYFRNGDVNHLDLIV